MEKRHKYNANNGPLKIKSTGILSLQKQILPKRDGEYNGVTWIGNNWQIDMSATKLAVFGWSTGTDDDRFRVKVEKGFLEMYNLRGTYTWVKN